MSLRVHLCEGEVDAVGERGDDEPPVEPHVLVAVGEGAGALPHHQLVRLALPVEAQLALPLELLSLQNAAHRAHVSQEDGSTTPGFGVCSGVGGGAYLSLTNMSMMSLACTSMMRTVLYFFLSFLLKGVIMRVTRSSICLCIFLA